MTEGYKMTKWESLSDDLKVCVRIYQDQSAGKDVWFSSLAELLKDEVSKVDLSKCEDKLMDLGILDKRYIKVDGMWTSCYQISPEAESFIKHIVENLGA